MELKPSQTTRPPQPKTIDLSRRRLPIGAEVVPGGVHFRVWAPKRKRVDVVMDAATVPLEAEDGGYFSGVAPTASAGTTYKLRLDGGEAFPDPVSRSQPDGPHGPSRVVDPSRFEWTDSEWTGLADRGQIFYEMHIGTFTPEGTFASAAEQLGELAGLGVTAVEVMPVAEFPGRFGWGYDGVNLFAPYHHYGTPDDFRAFVNRAHEEGIGVVLDVVYNHVGPDGNYLRQFGDAYFSTRYHTDWGDAINYDDRDSAAVRELVLSNVRHWISEYHVDGLRLDATDNIYDASKRHLLADIGEAARAAGEGRRVLLVAENESQDSHIVQDPARGGFGLDMLWNDDFHHSAAVAATGMREAYFTDYRGTPQEFISAMKHGYLYQGQYYTWQKKLRGSSTRGVPARRFVHYLQNHDQIANSATGQRLHQITSPGRYRALTALLLLGPQTPLLFQGQEFGASAPFQYFADHNPQLRKAVREGRSRFLAQFPSIADPKVRSRLADPGDPDTFGHSRLDLRERQSHREHYELHRDLIALRRCDPVFASGDARVDGAVLSDAAFVIRFFSDDGNDRLLLVNLGPELRLDIAPEPLLAPAVRGRGWLRLWHSEDECYGGRGAAPLEWETGSWRIPAESATLLATDDA